MWSGGAWAPPAATQNAGYAAPKPATPPSSALSDFNAKPSGASAAA